MVDMSLVYERKLNLRRKKRNGKMILQIERKYGEINE